MTLATSTMHRISHSRMRGGLVSEYLKQVLFLSTAVCRASKVSLSVIKIVVDRQKVMY
jgi:hypothetical protein